MRPAHDRPLAMKGLISYRYRDRYGWIMIGALDTADALHQARSSTAADVIVDHLEVWNGAGYVPVVQT